ncbi:MAG: rhomboid family intramembrane serine protease [Hyphomicrobium sp.]|nr:rhomboid family intramembrane serine protease [Hyphomicrobium sp.]
MTTDDEGQRPASEPIFNVPPLVLASVVVLALLHIARHFMTPQFEEWWIVSMAFIPARYGAVDLGFYGAHWAGLTSLVTHMLVHGDVTHLAFNIASLLAFGGAIEKRLGALRYVVLFLVSGVAGALLFLAINPGAEALLIGASGGIAGLMGATMRFLFNALERGGLRRLHQDPKSIPLMPLGVALRDRRVLIAVGSFFAINLLAFFGWGNPSTFGGIAWEAHIGGFVAGFLLMGFLDVAPRNSGQRKPLLY